MLVREANDRPGLDTGSYGGPATGRYITVGTTLLTMGTFAGTLTFTVLLTLTVESDDIIRSLLGYSSALFMASITFVLPGIVALQPYSDNERPSRVIFWMVLGLYSFASTCMSVAFFLLMSVLQYYTDHRAYVLGIVLLSVSTSITLFNSLVNLGSYFVPIPWL
jgi:hypothetical protein